MRRVLIVLAVVAALGAACGDDDEESAGTTTAAEGGPASITVEVDGTPDDFTMSALAYFPQAVTVHAGDTVRFHSNDTGEPHTVTLGGIVDAGLNAFNALPDEIKNADGPPSEEDIAKLPADQQKAVQDALALDEKLPPLLPDGPGDANQLGANPCFQASGDPATDEACEKVTQPAFDGTQSLYNSGYLPDDATFEVELADDIAPGTYNYFCLLHRQGMTGTITVVAETQDVPSSAQVADTAADELESRFASKLRAQNQELAAKPADEPLAGAPPVEGVEEGALNVFAPAELSVKAGSAVTWTVAGPHTIAVDAPADAVGAMAKAPDGTWHANQKAFEPVGGAGAPPPSEEPPAENAPPVQIDGGAYGGSGFHSSGFIGSFGPPGYQYTLTFAKAGTYTVQCQIHPDMKQTVKVA
ncbi:MAG: hypothetical protein ACRD0N_08695 [Acidimicrobiales bacterium]